MAQQYPGLNDQLTKFIEAQKIFFVGSAAAEGRINVSPKGQDSLRVLDANTIVWMNLTGSGNETAAHLREINRITLMWCAFEGPPMILRAYGNAEVFHPRDDGFAELAQLIPSTTGTRQYFRVNIDLVQTSCGYAVPLMDYQEERRALTLWSEKKGDEGIAEYWEEKNQRSLDGLPTGISDA
jgi:hypothetical protein